MASESDQPPVHPADAILKAAGNVDTLPSAPERASLDKIPPKPSLSSLTKDYFFRRPPSELPAASTTPVPPLPDTPMAAETQDPQAPSEPAETAVAEVPAGLAEAPSEPYVAAAPFPMIKAHVDGSDQSGMLSGWAYVRGNDKRKVDVRLLIGGEVIATAPADKLRLDVRAAGHGDGLSGFRIQIPSERFDGATHQAVVHFEAGDGIEPLDVEISLAFPGKKSAAPAEIPQRPKSAFNRASRGTGEVPEMPAPVYVPGQFISCAGGALSPYHVRGWQAPETGFTWIDGLEGTLEMSIRRPVSAYQMALDVSPNNVPGGPIQTLEIFINYLRMGFFEIPHQTSVSLVLPAEIFVARKTVINLHCRNAVAGKDFGLAETRRLGVALHSWVIH